MDQADLLKGWFGPRDWFLVVCEVDLKAGGAWRFLVRGPDGTEMGMRGVYREVKPPERLVSTEKFDETWYPGEAVNTLVLIEQGSYRKSVWYCQKDVTHSRLDGKTVEEIIPSITLMITGCSHCREVALT